MASKMGILLVAPGFNPVALTGFGFAPKAIAFSGIGNGPGDPRYSKGMAELQGAVVVQGSGSQWVVGGATNSSIGASAYATGEVEVAVTSFDADGVSMNTNNAGGGNRPVLWFAHD